MNYAELYITDGDELDVDLLYYFEAATWNMATAKPKDGGVYNTSPFADYRRLILKKQDNTVETIQLIIHGSRAERLAAAKSDLRECLEAASSFWTTNWQDGMVYLVARGIGETQYRYALLVQGVLEEASDYFGVEGSCQNPYAPLLLTVERQDWLESPPGVGVATEISAVDSYGGMSFGNVDSAGDREPVSTGDVYIANKQTLANITHVFRSALTPNLQNAALPVTLFDGAVAGQYVYFGVNGALSDAGPFCSLVFDIERAATGLTIQWQYYNGAWLAFPVIQDNTDGFKSLGVNSVSWRQPSDWIERTLGGVTGYWVRALIVTAAGGAVNPRQGNRKIYTVTWPYIEIQEDEIPGELPALARLLLTCQGDTPGHDPTVPADDTHLYANRMLVGLRSLSRGDDFTAYINISDVGNPTGITLFTGVDPVFSDDPEAPTGRSAAFGSVVAGESTPVQINFSQTIARQFRGVFHAFLRVDQTTGSAGDIGVKLAVAETYAARSTWEMPEYVYPVSRQPFEVLDMGRLSLLDPDFGNEEPYQLAINILINVIAAPAAIKIYDLILIPTDEWMGDFSDYVLEWFRSGLSNMAYYAGGLGYLDIDSIVNQRRDIRANVRNGYDRRTSTWLASANGPAILQAGGRQRLWFFSSRYPTIGSQADERADPYALYSVQLERNARFLGPRGG